MELELIEKYLNNEMTDDERQKFEERMSRQPLLKEDVRTVAYIIHAIREKGLERDNERIDAIRRSAPGNRKRYIISVAAMFIVLFAIAAIVSVPVYKHVIKPAMEWIGKDNVNPNRSSEVISVDSLKQDDTAESMQVEPTDMDDTGHAASEGVPSANTTTVNNEEATKKNAPVVNNEEPQKKEEILKEEKSVKVQEEKPKQQEPTEKPKAKKVNTITPPPTLKNYTFSKVNATRRGNSVVCTFTMTNTEEDASIQMHSARAKDNNGKLYNANVCLLNGKSKRIKEKWAKGEPHTITITINGVDANVSSFSQISFSFQSDGKVLNQNSMPIILNLGDI